MFTLYVYDSLAARVFVANMDSPFISPGRYTIPLYFLFSFVRISFRLSCVPLSSHFDSWPLKRYVREAILRYTSFHPAVVAEPLLNLGLFLVNTCVHMFSYGAWTNYTFSLPTYLHSCKRLPTNFIHFNGGLILLSGYFVSGRNRYDIDHRHHEHALSGRIISGLFRCILLLTPPPITCVLPRRLW